MSLLALLHPAARIELWPWSIHISTVIGILGLGALYAWRAKAGVGPGSSGVLGPWRPMLFFAGLLVMFGSLNGPIHDLSDDYLFSAHMVQHLLLTLAVPPLLISGTPGWMLRPALRSRVVLRAARLLTRPASCFLIFNLTIIAWHLPPLYNLAMANHGVHIGEHLLFMASAVLMWWPLMSPLPELPRLAYPGQMLYTFAMMIPMSVVAVAITYADHVLYPAYAAAARVIPLSPLEDQRLGGLIMWIPGNIVFIAVLSAVFFNWSASGEDSTVAAQVDWDPPPADDAPAAAGISRA